MARFKKPPAMSKYLKGINKDFNDFDFYCLFAMLGVAMNKKVTLVNGGDMLASDDFTKEFKKYQELYALIVMLANMASKKFDPNNANHLKDNFKEFLSKGYSNPLSDKGKKALDNYANGGFKFYSEKYPAAQLSLSQFLLRINTEIEEGFKTNTGFNF